MTETAFATGDNLTQKLWSESVIREAVKDIFFAKFTGKGGYKEAMNSAPNMNSIITVKSELTKKKGDQITVPLRMRLTNDAVDTENADLEGNEEEMIFHDFSVVVQEKGNAVRAKNKMALQRPAFDLRTEFKDGLTDWLSEYIDIQTITVLSASPTSAENIFGGDATSTADIDSSDTMSTSVISKAKRNARLRTPKVRAVTISGKEYYVLLLHDYQFKAVQAESAWYSAQREAGVRGLDNPMFSGAEGMWDGVVLHKYERIKNYATWGSGSNLNGARALLLGAQAGCHVWAQYPQWYEKLFDYNRIPGVASDLIWRAAKTVFNSKDFGLTTVDTYIAVD